MTPPAEFSAAGVEDGLTSSQLLTRSGDTEWFSGGAFFSVEEFFPSGTYVPIEGDFERGELPQPVQEAVVDFLQQHQPAPKENGACVYVKDTEGNARTVPFALYLKPSA